ncbi:AMIN-like domain-containing (lipo)protein [Nocardia callitridis]|uniref:AMIN-like domain-containing protein n=1 Tax=Nocardia callitridis TaxID=648753 RepID=A0ABP9JRS7_9NOCA
MRKATVSTAVSALVLTATAALLTSCGEQRTPTEAPTPSTTQSGTLAEAPPTPRDALTKRGDASPGAGLTVSNIEVGAHPGFDRVVYELGGTGVPGWVVQYTDQATQDGSGRPVDVAGRSVLEVRILGSAYPFDSGVEPYSGPDPATGADASTVAGVYRNTVFEGTTQSFIGIEGDRPGFSVSTLADPTRLVIDVATE